MQTARAEGLPEAAVSWNAVGGGGAAGGGERRPLDPPRVTQIPALGTGGVDDIVDAELVDSPREERR